jgi:hypothetical protein
MLALVGSRVCYRTVGSGVFHCERCGGDRPYRHRSGRRWANLFGIPLARLDGTVEHLRCAVCGTCYRVGLLAVPTIEQMLIALLVGTKAAVLAMLRAGGAGSPAARRRAVQMIRAAGAPDYHDGRLLAALASPGVPGGPRAAASPGDPEVPGDPGNPGNPGDAEVQAVGPGTASAPGMLGPEQAGAADDDPRAARDDSGAARDEPAVGRDDSGVARDEPAVGRDDSGVGLRPAVEAFAIQLEIPAREWFLAKIVEVGVADGPLSPAEREVAGMVARYLGMTAAHGRDVIMLAEEAAQAG